MISEKPSFREYYEEAIDRLADPARARRVVLKERLKKDLEPVDHSSAIRGDLVPGDPKQSYARGPFDNKELRALYNSGEIPIGYGGYLSSPTKAKKTWGFLEDEGPLDSD